MRAHFTRPVTDGQGDLLPNVQVSVFDPATTDLIGQTLYSSDTGNTVLTNPFVSNTGVIDLYLDTPARVRFGIVQGNLPMQFYEDVDVLAAGSDSQHSGTGPMSLVIGFGASTPGDMATAIGPSASAAGTNSVALGASTNALGEFSVAAGSSASTQALSGVALGNNATSTGVSGTALGCGTQASALSSTAVGPMANAAFEHSTAIGADAESSGDFQVMLGTGNDVVEIPQGSGLIMTAPDGNRWKITIDDDGSLVTTSV